MDISVVVLEKSEVSAEAVAVAVSDLKGTAGKQHFYSTFSAKRAHFAVAVCRLDY